MGAGLAALRRGGLRRLPVAARPRAASAARSTSASSTTSCRASAPSSGFFYNADGPHRGSPQYPVDALPKAKACRTTSRCSAGMQNGHRRALPEVPAPRLPRAAVRQHVSGSSARATARSTTGSARRRAARRRAAWTASRSRSATGRRHHRHRHRLPGPADRHQHHRPGGRGSALHRWRRWSRMIALATTCNRLGHPRRHPASAGSSTSSPTASAARPELGSEIELAPNRKPYYDDETLEGTRLERVQLIGVLLLVVDASSACRCTGCSSPAARRARSSGKELQFAELGPGAVRDHRQRRLQLRRLPRRHEGHRRRRALQPSPIRRPVRSRRSTGTPRRSTRCCTASPPTRCTFILTYGRPFSPMSAWGIDRRRPDERPADRDDHRLPPQHPAAPAGCLTEPAFEPESSLTDLSKLKVCDGGTLPADEKTKISKAATAAAQTLVDAGQVLHRRRGDGRGAVQPRHQQRRLQLRSLPHRGLELRQPGGARSGRVRLEPHRRLARPRTSRVNRT